MAFQSSAPGSETEDGSLLVSWQLMVCVLALVVSSSLAVEDNNNNNNNVYLLSAVPQSQTGLTALYNEIKAGHNNELSKIKMNLK